jgi:diguanylate cyclase (GGDEF)-like protein
VITPRWARPAFLLVGVLAALAWLYGDIAVKTVAICGFNMLALAVVAVRAARDEPGHPSRLLLPGFVVYTVAQLAFILVPAVTGNPLPFPSLADAGFFLAYCFYGAVLVRVLRRRLAVPKSVLDVLIVAAGLSAPLWEFVVRPAVSSGVAWPATVATLMYPVMLTGLLAIALRLVFLTGFRGLPDVLLLGWVASEFGANLFLSIATANGTYTVFAPWFIFLFASWAFIGTLALSPVPSTAPARRQGRGRYGRLVLLGSALLLPLATLHWVSDREATYALVVATALTIAILVRLSMVTADLTELQQLSRDLEHRALHDALTGLPNRVLLSDRIDNALAQRVTGPGRAPALLLLDLDSFKSVNDTHGHEQGDLLLIAVAGCLLEVCRAGDTVARLGGDEFAVLLPDTDLAQALRIAERIALSCTTRGPLGELTLSSSASIGLVLADGQDRSTLLRQADIAMYAAKARGGGTTAVFDVELHAELLARHHREIELRGAAARGELVLEYQPVMHLARNEMVGVEALVRWQHPVHGRIPPLEFIPLAEESGSIKQIGAWVLEQACRQALAWDAEHPLSPPLHIAVNLSPRQLVDDGLVEMVRKMLEQLAIDPARVTLEVTESALCADTEMMISKLDQLKALGVRLAIDDFGTGYSSLSFLRRLPVDILKIDKSFVDGIAREPEEWALTTAIVRLATSLGKQTLAEGVELGEQLAHLRALSCELGQGYLFDRPLPAAMVSERIAAAASRRAGAVRTDART